jgi:hypothetical protein
VFDVLVIFGWLRRFTVLGVKIDECPQCGKTCEHVVGRKTRWAHVFWFPIVFLGFSHGMICTTCNMWTGIRWRQVRAAMRSGSLPLDRVRGNATLVLAENAGEGEPPLHPALVYDCMLINPKRGVWDLYFKLWPVLVVALIALATVATLLTPPRKPGSGGSTTASAHTCWEDGEGAVTGCQLDSGEIMGTKADTVVTCFFKEPLPETDVRLRCDH